MRLIWWEGDAWPGITGARIVALELLTALRRRSYEIVVIADMAPGEAEEESWNGLQIHRFPFHRALVERDVDAIAKIRGRLSVLRKEFDPAIVHLHSLLPHSLFVLTTFANHDSALLVSRHSASVGGGKAGAYALPRRVLGAARWIACCSQDVLRETCLEVPEVADRCSVIYNGLSDPGREPVDLVMEPPHLVCVGRLVRQKGFDIALAAFARIAADFPGARLTIGGDGPERGSLAAQAEELGLGDATEFPGWIVPSAVAELIETASVVLVPSRDEEGFGLVALQAAQMARPVVASRIGGLPEVVIDGETGVLVEPDDPAGVARAVSGLIRSPEKAAAMGRAGRTRARAEFGADRFVAEYTALYDQLLHDPIEAVDGGLGGAVP